MTFPSNPNEDDLHEAFGRKLRYRSGKWQVVSSPTVATVTEEAPKTEAVAQAVDLPMTGNEIGAMTYVQESNRLYVWNGSGWFEVALVNTNPTITAGGSATYELATDGTPTVVTLTANDPEGIPLAWSYTVTSGSLGGTTVTNVDNVFTITPSTDTNDAGTFQLTFIASDGVNVDTSASSFTLAFGPNWANTTLIHSIADPNAYGTTDYDYFGYSVSTDGSYFIASAPYEDDGSSNSGKAYIFNAITGSLVKTLDNPNASGGAANDNFGRQGLSILGNYAAVASFSENATSGIVYIFKTTDGTWSDATLLHVLTNPNNVGNSAEDYFGWNVSISGNYLIVGAWGEGSVGGVSNYSGTAYIYNLTTGSLIKTLVNPNAATTGPGERFGESVSISGNYLIVSAPRVADASGTNSGKAYIYKTNNGTWSDAVNVFTLDNPNMDGLQADLFGISCSIDGDYCIVGSRNEAGQAGAVYTFNATTGTLLQSISKPASIAGNANFGMSVAISDGVAVVGSPNSATVGGYICILDVLTGDILKIIQNPNASGTAANDGFGGAQPNGVSISGDIIVAGAQYEGGDRGYVYVFQAG